MSVVATKSASITNRDASPPVANTTGIGAQGYLKEISDYTTLPASQSITSVNRIVRVPTDAKMKSLILEAEAQAAGTYDIGLYYSSSANDGTSVANQSAVIDADFFASAVNNAAAIAPTEVLNESGNNGIANRNKPLWQAAGLSADPGGFFDICATIVSVDVTTGTGKVNLSARYVQ